MTHGENDCRDKNQRTGRKTCFCPLFSRLDSYGVLINCTKERYILQNMITTYTNAHFMTS